MNRYAIALDWCHRTADRKRARDEPPPALQHAHARKEKFVPADPSGQVGLFVCGPTVYDLPHLGHAKTYTHFDFLVRLLRARGFAVTYVQNITDVDDKIIRRERELGIDASDLARRNERGVAGRPACAAQRLRGPVRARHGDQRAPAGRAVRPAWRRDRPDLPAPRGRDRTDGDDLRPAADGRVLVAHRAPNDERRARRSTPPSTTTSTRRVRSPCSSPWYGSRIGTALGNSMPGHSSETSLRPSRSTPMQAPRWSILTSTG
jgi:hypothetical protein